MTMAMMMRIALGESESDNGEDEEDADADESESDNGDDEDKEDADADADDILMLMHANLPRAESTFHTAPTVNAYSYRLASNGLLVIIIIINIFTITTLKRKYRCTFFVWFPTEV